MKGGVYTEGKSNLVTLRCSLDSISLSDFHTYK